MRVCIPAGMTSLLEPLDVCINRLFKAHLKHFYSDWMAIEVHETTPIGKTKEKTGFDIAVWDLISNDLAVKSFKECCI